MKFPRLRPGKAAVGLLGSLLLVLGYFALRAYLQSPDRGLPYRDSFAKGQSDEWRALGGAWELVDGAMRNNSDERGDKLLTGSPFWHNYSIDADVTVLGNGDAGIMIRSNNEEKGVNSYSGYYAGVRVRDGVLVLGRGEHGWLEAANERPVPGGIHPFQWYHLKLLAYDCNIFVALTSPTRSAPFSFGINDHNCIQSGRIGLRSYAAGGIWRNVVVRPATLQDLDALLNASAVPQQSDTANVAAPSLDLTEQRYGLDQQSALADSSDNIQNIASLRLASLGKPLTATTRGVVILTSPRLYIEDPTGGAYIPQPAGPLLKVGDEVEVTGELQSGDFSLTINHAAVHLLWARSPISPVSVTASQASTGKYDASRVEVQGRLVGKSRGPDNTILLDLDDGPQAFRAILNPGRSDYLFTRLNLGSVLRLRGICVGDPAFTHNLIPFVLLLSSTEDLDVIAGPPWWSTGHLIALAVGLLLLTLVAVIVYNRIEHWRLRTVLEERGRLAHEMHDTLAQCFAGIGFQLQAIRNGLPEETGTLHQQLELASNLVRHSHEEARRSIATLRSEDLDSQDILSALEGVAHRMVDGGSVQIIIEREGDQRSIPLRIADTIFRIGQEAVANAVRHAQPTLLTLRLTYSDDCVRLEVLDDGAGFEPGTGHQGFGIRGMRRRAQSISAVFSLQSRPGHGTRIEIVAPLPPRVTLVSWPKHLLRYIREYWIDGGPKRKSNSNFYR